MAKKTRLEKIAEKLEKVAKMVFAHAYKRYAWEYRASHDFSLEPDEVITIENARCNCGLHFTINHMGKMTGMKSLSTSCKRNENCARNSKIKGSICEACFAARQMDYMPTMEEPLAKNLEILTSEIIDVNDLPIINVCWFRIESFGDLMNEIQAINYLNLIRNNPQTFFGWWTKNPHIIEKAFEITGYEKPSNCNIIWSSLFINKAWDVDRYWFVDKVFTVYDQDKENDIQINCGARSCLKCRLCYSKNDIKYVSEIKK